MAKLGKTNRSSDRFDFYHPETCLLIDTDRHIISHMTKIRFGIADIVVQRLRYANDNQNFDILCPLCKNAKEDETHLLLCCPVYEDLRNQYTPRKFHENPCLFHVVLLMANQNEIILRNVCMFLYKVFKRLAILLSEVEME